VRRCPRWTANDSCHVKADVFVLPQFPGQYGRITIRSFTLPIKQNGSDSFVGNHQDELVRVFVLRQVFEGGVGGLEGH
jgi:hypothetical protein